MDVNITDSLVMYSLMYEVFYCVMFMLILLIRSLTERSAPS